jgi:murein DD-endopeptidase MepM/ murein hydrolase activator NlpD
LNPRGALIGFVTLCAGCAHLAPGGVDPLEGARTEVMSDLERGDGDALFGRYDDNMRGLGLPSTRQFATGIQQAGPFAVEDVVSTTMTSREWLLSSHSGTWLLTLALAKDGRIAMLWLRPKPPEPPVRSSTIALRLPFDGQWFVTWGGPTRETNKHASDPNQRRAADLLVLQNGKSHRGEGQERADFYAYGRPVLAVADGEVVTVVDGFYETELGRPNPYGGAGNMIILKLSPELYAMYGHLQPGSMQVRAGDRVNAGQPLGLCGNAGNSTEPHLHFQLQDGPRLESSFGVEPVFARVRVTRGGKTELIERYTFLQGDLIEQP